LIRVEDGCSDEGGDTQVCDAESPPERTRLLKQRPFAGKFQEFKAKAADHFAEDPVAAPHPRFHPVPTRPVFSPIPPEELAVLLAPPPDAQADKTEPDSKLAMPPKPTPTTGAPEGVESPVESPPRAFEPPHVVSPPVDVSPTAPPTRTARPDVPATPALLPTPAPSLKPAGNAEETESEREPKLVHSIFEPQSADSIPSSEIEYVDGDDEGPLLWRVVPTPAGSLRATPAD
jgi:hypothetical protein